MIRKIIKWALKCWLVGIVNTTLEKYNENVATSRKVVTFYSNKVRAVLSFLDNVDMAIRDGKLTNEEADAIEVEAKHVAGHLAERYK